MKWFIHITTITENKVEEINFELESWTHLLICISWSFMVIQMFQADYVKNWTLNEYKIATKFSNQESNKKNKSYPTELLMTLDCTIFMGSK